ncbi:hypothetical protein SGLAM104S_03554 [Streptomyces glaucescens]
MAEPEFTATDVRIGKGLRSLSQAGQVRIRGGRLELLTSYGSEIDSAPVQAVRASRPWFGSEDRALADLNGTRYLLTLGERDGLRVGQAPDKAACTTTSRASRISRWPRSGGPPRRCGPPSGECSAGRGRRTSGSRPICGASATCCGAARSDG